MNMTATATTAVAKNKDALTLMPTVLLLPETAVRSAVGTHNATAPPARPITACMVALLRVV
jgi:hypothetical protein